MKIVLCEDEKGYKWATVVQADCGESGIVLGPPPGLDQSVHNTLAENGFYSVKDLLGKRKLLKQLVNQDRTLLNMIYHVYQQDYWRK